MNYWIVFSLILGSCYVLLIFSVLREWNRGIELHYSKKLESIIQISVIIAARNEGNGIQKSLLSILSNCFPTAEYEIIVIDDHSEDDTIGKIKSLKSEQVNYWSLPKELTGKKSAITYGIAKAKFPIILCTDADTVVRQDWLSTHARLYQDQTIKMATGVVLPDDVGTLLSRFQFFDFAATMLVTHFGISKKKYYLCNGANFSYRKEIFTSVGGFDGNSHIASGDDIFLMQKVSSQHPEGITFIKSKQGVVITKSENSWSSLLNQRIRWASKSMRVDSATVQQIQGFVFFYCGYCVISLLLCFFLPKLFLIPLVLALGIKLITDYIFLKRISHEFDRKQALNSFFSSFWVYFLHIIVSGFVALFPKSYGWKGRRVTYSQKKLGC